MSLFISLQTELIKTKRSAALWLAVLGAGMIPLIYFLFYVFKPATAAQRLGPAAWEGHFLQGWQAFSGFLLPMFVILICSLVPQIEYKNNAWKQVYASPQSLGNIFFSKYLAIVLMILVLFVMFNVFMIMAGYIPNLFHSQLTFFKSPVPVMKILSLSGHTFISLLAIISLQYWFSLRFRNFIVPIGVGLGLLVATLVAMGWEHVDKLPYSYPYLSFTKFVEAGSSGVLFKHEVYGIVYFIVFTLIGFLDMKMRKERG